MNEEHIELVTRVEQQLADLQRSVALLKNELAQLEIENNRLRMNNTELKETIYPVIEESFFRVSDENDTPTSSGRGYQSMKTFYNDRIHICHEFFGSRLQPGEDCLFCLDVLKRLK